MAVVRGGLSVRIGKPGPENTFIEPRASEEAYNCNVAFDFVSFSLFIRCVFAPLRNLIAHRRARDLRVREMAPFANHVTREILGHRRRVHSVAWNCAGRKLASASVDTTARVYDVERGGVHSGRDVELKGHGDSVDQVAWDPVSPDRLATISADKTLRLWDVRSGGSPIATINLGDENINLSWTKDGSQIAVGNRNDLFHFIDAKTHKVTHTTSKFPYQVNGACWNETGDEFVVTTADGFAQVLSFPDLKPLRQMRGHTSSVYAMALDKVNDRWAFGGADAGVSVWDHHDSVCVGVVDRLNAPVRAVAFSHDGKFLASGGDDPVIDVADANVDGGATFSAVTQIQLKSVLHVSSMAWSPTHHVLAFGGNPGGGGGKDGGGALWASANARG